MFRKEKKYFIPLAVLLFVSSPLVLHAAEEAKEMKLTILEQGPVSRFDATSYFIKMRNENRCPFTWTGVDTPGIAVYEDQKFLPKEISLASGKETSVSFTLQTAPDGALGNTTVFLAGFFQCPDADRVPLHQMVAVTLINPAKWALSCTGTENTKISATLREPRYEAKAEVTCTNLYPYAVKVTAFIRNDTRRRFFFPMADVAADPTLAEEGYQRGGQTTDNKDVLDNKTTILLQPNQTGKIPVWFRPYFPKGRKEPGIFAASLLLAPEAVGTTNAPDAVTIPLRGRVFTSPIMWSLHRKNESQPDVEEKEAGFLLDFGTLPKNQIPDTGLTLRADSIAPYKIERWTVELDSARKDDWIIEKQGNNVPIIGIKLKPGLDLGVEPRGTLTVKAQVRDTEMSGAPPREMSWVFPLSAKIEKPIEQRGHVNLGRVHTGVPVVLSMLPNAPAGLQGRAVKGELRSSRTGPVVAGATVGVDPATGRLTLQFGAEVPPALKSALLTVSVGKDNPDVWTWTLDAEVYTPIRAAQILLGDGFFPGDETTVTLPWPPFAGNSPPLRWDAWVHQYDPPKPWLRLQPTKGQLEGGVLPPVQVVVSVPSDVSRGSKLTATVMAALDGNRTVEFPLVAQVSRRTPWSLDAGMSLHALSFGDPRQTEFLWFNRVGGAYNVASLKESHFVALSMALFGGISPSYKMAGLQVGLQAGRFFGKSEFVGVAGGGGFAFGGNFSDVAPSLPQAVSLFFDAKLLLNLGAKAEALRGWSLGLGVDAYIGLNRAEEQRTSTVHVGPMLYVQHRFGY